ncbi:hypothetical protein GCK72_026057 [Caenorhabditis remanei]|uniref:EF-hand domain-containing protein n=1 Tax=Caenorhabditis remanei TaxID=31234 RepID=A0A6A5G526_CAERE|nr:hypothetical protein GCK72_026057 [Caenorhabditis remanei]KAF1749589.1 hypothetical protein GCK72_026057 [Caenorhabditis remanei]
MNHSTESLNDGVTEEFKGLGVEDDKTALTTDNLEKFGGLQKSESSTRSSSMSLRSFSTSSRSSIRREYPSPPPYLFEKFPEFSREQIKVFVDSFYKFDKDQDCYLNFMEIKRFMESLGEAQTHLATIDLLKQLKKDKNGKFNLEEFIMLFRLATKTDAVSCLYVFKKLADSINVQEVGVKAAARFFEAKAEEAAGSKVTKGIPANVEAERLAELEKQQKLEEEKKAKKAKFQKLVQNFQ